jgi:hypothetical protein
MKIIPPLSASQREKVKNFVFFLMTFFLRSVKVPGPHNVVDHVGHDEGVLGQAEEAVDVGLAVRVVAAVEVQHLR